jgi:signal transduction histidine kinase
MIATTEEFHRLYTAADRDRASVENSMTRLDTLARETLRESEESRVAVAHALHDTAGQSAVAAHRFLEAARASVNSARPEQAVRNLDEAQETLLTTIKEIRAVLNNLVPPGLEELGLTKALQRYVEEFVPDAIAAEIAGELPRAEYWLEAGLFAMTAEAVNNAVQHGRPAHIKIDLRASRGRGIITVTDDGVGFDPAAAHRRTLEGMGLIGMQRRAGWLGGRVDIVSRQGTGTTISITVPLEDPERAD